MSLFHWILLLVFPILGINLYATVGEIYWLKQATQLLFIIGILAIYLKQKKRPRINECCFIVFFFLAKFAEFFAISGNYELLSLFFYILAFIALSREVISQTKREKASKVMLLYSFLLFVINAYLLFTHLLELKSYISSDFRFTAYIVYYLNLLILGVISLIYYLNSYSEKSIYCVTLVLAFVFADVFKDAAHFYMQDLAILIIGNLLWFIGLIFSLLFFLTPERKLRLMDLI
jgi:hypothetical protein